MPKTQAGSARFWPNFYQKILKIYQNIPGKNPANPVSRNDSLAALTVVSEAIPGWCSTRENRQFKGQARSHPVIPCHTPGGTACYGCRSQGPRAMDPEDLFHKGASIILRWCCVTPPVLAMRPVRSGIPMTSPQCTGDDSVASGLLQGHRRPWCLSLLAGYTKLRLHFLALSERVTLV